jgi:hydroxymethylpyrimidine kinase/phosphomethylpyrimidine kinase
MTPPIVYTIAGSDSGGGAGIQADLHAIHTMKCHGCSAITCLTAQNSVGVTGVHAPPASFLQQQLETLLEDLPPRAIKIGMIGTKEIAETVGAFLQKLKEENSDEKVWVVLDPVMISTSGHKLIDDDAKESIIQKVFPYADILTPNKYEAEELLGRTFESNQDVEEGMFIVHPRKRIARTCTVSSI